ncbi:MAG: ribosome biogenesis GTP-binding protein YihA/YsxC [Burkholderiales bacterium]|nr:YihA family ribosome biogenesis GTP-binding protein [Ferrovum sp.]
MSLFQKAEFFTTVNEWAGLPPDDGVEVAFAGRSNAGKSSAINVLANRSRLAYTSKTPGRTQHINFFSLGEQRYLVDLPGYGYAKVPLAVKHHWQVLLSDYLVARKSLHGLVVLMDIRHPLTDLDRQLLDWFLPSGKPVVVLLTKADKLGRGAKLQVLREVRESLVDFGQRLEVIAFSSMSREGLEDADAAITRLYQPQQA